MLVPALAAGLVGARATEPSSPPNPVFDPFKYGAKGDGTTNDRAALQRALDACAGTGGSVYLHDGKFLTGQITLGSDTTLFIGPTATLLGIQSTAESDYPAKKAATDNHINVTCQKRLIWGEGLKNVTIAGGGTIDGQGDFKPWLSGKTKVQEYERPSILEFARCDNVQVSGIKIVRSACWTQVYLECNHLVLRKLTIDTGNLPGNRDGMDICDCHDVLIEDCDVKSQDDGICFKSGNSVGCSHVLVRNCVVDKLGISAGNPVKFGTASQGSFRDVVCENITVKNTRNSAFTWESVDGAVIENVEVRHCRVSNVGQVIALILGQRRGKGGTIRNVVFRDIVAEAGARPIACFVSGVPGQSIEDVQFIGLDLRLPGGVATPPSAPAEYAGEYPEGTHFGDLPSYAFYVRHASGVTFKDCKFDVDRPDVRPWLVTQDVSRLSVTNVTSQGKPATP